SSLTPGALEQLVSVLQGLQQSLSKFHEHQAETLRVHEQYLKHQHTFSQDFLKLLQSNPALPTNGSALHVAAGSEPPSPVHLEIAHAPVQFTPKTDGNQHGNGSAKTANPGALQPSVHSVQSSPEPLPAVVIASPPVAAPVQVDVAARLLEVISEKTGYPGEMLELEMDMEADLGIDSIKRVEILGAMRAHFPDLPKVDPEAFAEMRTLTQVIDHIHKTLPTPGSAVAAAPPVAVVSPAPPAMPSAATLDVRDPSADEVGAALLAIVSEKTGYPSEMLELGMDMEADLGIDSIKRVEILGAMRNVYPDLPKVEPEVFAEMRTLAQVIEHIQKTLPGNGAATPAAVITEAVSQSQPVAVIIPTTSRPDHSNLVAALLEVVSEKTGYPSEMLELEMDMEADLGIDSIKRVEILGAMRNVYPDLPKVAPEAFAELRTLGQVTEHIRTHLLDAHDPAGAQSDTSATLNPEGIQRGLAMLKSLPEPDAMDVKLAEGHISLITDDGTEATVRLAGSLLERGLQPVVLSFPESSACGQPALPQGVARVVLQEMSEAHLALKLDELSAAYGKPAVVIHMHPGCNPQAQKTMVKFVFLMAKHVKESLTDAARQGRAAFMTVVRMDGEFGLGRNTDFDPVSGGLFGLVKSLNLEWQTVFCRGIDLSPALDAQQAAERIVAELSDPNRLVTEVAYTAERRATLVVAEANMVA
ncbi:MAG: phosphopantetheine-binding protein, partial [Anaerolineaceae bacterium]